MNRRELFEQTGRWLSGALIALLGGYLALEREIAPPASCSENPFCGQCRKFSGCEKPQAASYRHSSGQTKKQSDGQR